MKPSKKLIGARIKSLREARRLTQEGLAERMDINPVYLSNIERGMANPILDMLIRLTEALETEMWELFDFAPEASLKELREALSRFSREMDEEKLKIAVKVLRALAR